jgi:hypothetical protein
MIKRTNDERDDDRDREAAVLAEIIKTRTAQDWEINAAGRAPSARALASRCMAR